MKGKVLFFDTETNRGIIEDKNKNQYSFHIGEWIGEEPIIVGEEVSFEIPKEEALNIRVKRVYFTLCLEKIKDNKNEQYNKKSNSIIYGNTNTIKCK